jgi:hypothetical protein
MPHAVAAVLFKEIAPMTTLKALEDSLYWMNVVYKQSTDPTQRERVKARIAKLEAQIEALKLEIAP